MVFGYDDDTKEHSEKCLNNTEGEDVTKNSPQNIIQIKPLTLLLHNYKDVNAIL